MMMTKIDLIDIFMKSANVDLNAIINMKNQTILVKMFDYDYFQATTGMDRLPIVCYLIMLYILVDLLFSLCYLFKNRLYLSRLKMLLLGIPVITVLSTVVYQNIKKFCKNLQLISNSIPSALLQLLNNFKQILHIV